MNAIPTFNRHGVWAIYSFKMARFGRTLFQSLAAGRGAAIGQFWGTVLKLAIGAIMAVMLAIAAFV